LYIGISKTRLRSVIPYLAYELRVDSASLYGAMMFAREPLWAIVLLFAFAFAIAGVNPIGVASVGRMMTPASMGVLLPVAAFGAILMPWFIGLVADAFGLQAGMMCNLLPCAGIMVISLAIRKTEKEA